MADFHQNGVVSTLHNFSHRPLEDIENELRIFAKEDPIELILPSLYSELERPALGNIIECLSKVKYLNHIVIGLDKANKSEFLKAKKFFSHLNPINFNLFSDNSTMSIVPGEISLL